MWPLNDKAMTGKLLSLFVMGHTNYIKSGWDVCTGCGMHTNIPFTNPSVILIFSTEWSGLCRFVNDKKPMYKSNINMAQVLHQLV